MYTAQSKALGLSNKFKIIQNPNSADILNMHNKFDSLADEMQGYFDSMELSDPTDVKVKDLILDKRPSQNYILVLGLISNVLGTKIYMFKILSDDDLKPKYALKFIGQHSDITLIYWVGWYLYHMEKNLLENMKRFRPHNMNGLSWQKHKTQELYNHIIQSWAMKYILHKLKFSVFHSKGRLKNLEIRNKKVFDYIINNLKFDKDINEIYRDTNRNNELPKRIYLSGGRFKVKYLIGT